jgi:hypothetical protein
MLSDEYYHYRYCRLYSLASECDMKEKGERIISRDNIIMSSPIPTSALPYLWQETEAIPDKSQMKWNSGLLADCLVLLFSSL